MLFANYHKLYTTN